MQSFSWNRGECSLIPWSGRQRSSEILFDEGILAVHIEACVASRRIAKTASG